MSGLGPDTGPDRGAAAGETRRYRLRGSGGLIDLNAADPLVLQRFFEAFLPGQGRALTQALAAARSDKPLRGPGDLLTLLDLPLDTYHRITPHLTTAHGNRRLSLEATPTALLHRLAGTEGPRRRALDALGPQVLMRSGGSGVWVE